MKKLIFAIALITISITGVKAQDNVTDKKVGVSIAVDAGIPTTTGWSFVIGGDLQADIAAAEGLKITLSGGYESFSLKSSYGGGSWGLIPLLAGAKFNLGSDKIYGHAQLGYSVATAKGGSGSFTYAPSIGYNVSPNFDVAIKYMGFDHLGQIGLRVAYDL